MKDRQLEHHPPYAPVSGTQRSADVWHGRLVHGAERVVRVAANIIEFDLALRDILAVLHVTRTSARKEHPKMAIHGAAAPLECVYTDLLASGRPQAK